MPMLRRNSASALIHTVTLPLLLVFLLVGLAACSGDDDDSDDESDGATPESVLQSASDRWAETDSAHFDLSIDGETFLDSANTIQLNSAEGDMKRPGSVAATAAVTVPVLGNRDVGLIVTDGTVYMTNILGGSDDWDEAPSDFTYDPSILFSDTEGVGPILADLENPELDGTEEIEGREARKVTGTVSGERVAAVTAEAVEGDAIDVTVWVDTETSDILKISLTEPESVGEGRATWNLVFSAFNEDVTIEPPAV